MRPFARALALITAAAGAACGALEPYPTAPPAPAAVGGAGQRVAICYNSLHTALAAVQQEAQQECDAAVPRTVAVSAETDWYLQTCPILLPARASFACIAKK